MAYKPVCNILEFRNLPFDLNITSGSVYVGQVLRCVHDGGVRARLTGLHSCINPESGGTFNTAARYTRFF